MTKSVKGLSLLSIAMTSLLSAGCQSAPQAADNNIRSVVTSTKTQTVRKPQTTADQGIVRGSATRRVSNKSTGQLATAVNTQYASMSALDMARQNPNLSILVEAVEASGIAGMLRFAGNDYTIFAPSNAAFEELFSETTLTKQKLLADKSLIRLLLAYHVIKTNDPLLASQLPKGKVTTYGKRVLTVTPQGNLLDGKGRTAHIIYPNVMTKNGSVHVIDKVMFPPNPS